MEGKDHRGRGEPNAATTCAGKIVQLGNRVFDFRVSRIRISAIHGMIRSGRYPERREDTREGCEDAEVKTKGDRGKKNWIMHPLENLTAASETGGGLIADSSSFMSYQSDCGSKYRC